MKNLIILSSIIFSIYVVFFQNNISIEKINNVNTESNKSKIEIVGLNNFSEEDLKIVKSTIEKFYGFDCVISDPKNVNLSSCESAQISTGENDYFSYDENEKIVIYVTNQRLYSIKNNESVLGLCFGNQIYLRGNIVYDRESSIELIKCNAIHEVAHSFGVSHCHNTCVMNSESFEFWDKKQDKPIFCDDCKSKLP
jgi:predicted Zn-dependent protease